MKYTLSEKEFKDHIFRIANWIKESYPKNNPKTKKKLAPFI